MCKHLQSYKREKGLDSYTLLHAHFVACIAKGSSKTKTIGTKCDVCKQFGYNARLHACMSCVFIGCFKRDMKTHAKEEMHEIAMDLLNGAIYCFKCQDYVYDDDFSSVAKKQFQLSEHMKGTHRDISWLPTKEDIKLFNKNKCKKLNQPVVGLRGIYNLGLTCYINCIIQVFAHTPMMRNYFLSDRHRCTREKRNCQACLCSDLFQELYSGETEPLSLPNLLYDLWKKNGVFFGKTANDANEFYGFYLEDLHKSCEENNSVPCRCVVHQIFSGVFERRTSCTSIECGISSTESLEFWSIGLGFDDDEVYQSAGGPKKVNLTDCIKRFIQIEEPSLDLDLGKKKCTTCKEGNEQNLNTLKVLPNILCFHMDHKKNKDGKKSKDQIQVVFPECLDMSSYTKETARSEMRQENGTKNFKTHTSKKNLYILYAVVCHKGEDGGHYYTYLRKGKGIWYKCNDEKIKKVDFKVVSNDLGILFFYIKEILEYETTQESREVKNVRPLF